jgi:hypothetical protein
MKIDPSEPTEIPEETLTCDSCGQNFDTVESLSVPSEILSHANRPVKKTILHHATIILNATMRMASYVIS